MTSSKIVVVGPVGAGKTTAVRTMTKSVMISTDETATDMAQRKKLTTTVALDYGLLIGTGAHKVHLYGAPGQQRFNFMWDIISLGTNAIVLLIDHSSAHPLKDLAFYLNEFREFSKSGRMVLGVTKADVAIKGDDLSKYEEYLAQNKLNIDVHFVDARKQNDVVALLDGALMTVHDDVSVAVA